MSVDLTIDGRPGSAAPDATILQAAHAAGIDIPTVCQDEFKVCACSVSAT
jgi:NADH dehydrogenase/NADH:ubiquinone oxidoreductase subunit G